MKHLNALRLSGSGGANRAMEAELKRVAARAGVDPRPGKPERVDEQNLRYPFEPTLAWTALHYLRTPSRVLWDLARFDAPRLEPLYAQVKSFAAQDQAGWLARGLGVSVHVRSIGDFPAGPLQVRGTVKNGILDGARERGVSLRFAPEGAELCFVVQPWGKGLLLSLDLAGQSQHRRGYRLEQTEAPLKETHAAQMLILARWDPRREALLDPMAGAGTIPVEGALMAAGAPLRHPDEEPPAHRLPAFEAVARRPRPDLFPGTPPPIFGNDLDPRALDASGRNAGRAGVGDRCAFLQGDLLDLDRGRLERAAEQAGWPAPELERGLVVTNPPYGQRIREDEDVERLYEDLVRWGQRLPEGWRFCFLAGHPRLEELIPTQPRLKKPMSNGPLKAHLLVYDRIG